MPFRGLRKNKGGVKRKASGLQGDIASRRIQTQITHSKMRFIKCPKTRS
ncbi:hypothetical protein OIU77_023379 [Salix suchowensis]|uniref:Ribosomal protein S18 n=1 Tax=Salix suchowensis TaxID=1278906 RepID=A0ABQ9C6X4_9ROSI|nr:hypothetical protein OIU77_023379 [Salix suchowensis]